MTQRGAGLTRRSLFAGVAAALLVGPARAGVEATLDPTFEWLGALARAAGFGEYRGGLEAWTTVLRPALRRVAGHRVVRQLQWARLTRGLAWDAVPSMAAHLAGPPDALVARVRFDPWPDGLDTRWRGVAGDEFVEAAADAARVAGFAALWEGHPTLLDGVRTAVARRAAELDTTWFTEFFGTPLPARLRVLGAMGSSGTNYGAHVVIDGVRETVAVLGVTTGGRGAPEVARLPVLVHEFGHDFVNPVVAANRDTFAAVGRRLYAMNARALRRQAYGDWETAVSEAVLRACVVRYLATHGGDVEAELAYQTRVGFPRTALLADALAVYEADRARWPTFAAFVPTLVERAGEGWPHRGTPG